MTDDVSIWEDGRRVTTMDSRYQVGDDCCGQIEWTPTKLAAIKLAQGHRDRHKRDNDPLTVRVMDLFHRKHPGRIVFEAKPEGDVYSDSRWLE